jgi:hypothetical protein
MDLINSGIDFKIDRSQKEGVLDFNNDIFPSHFTVNINF